MNSNFAKFLHFIAVSILFFAPSRMNGETLPHPSNACAAQGMAITNGTSGTSADEEGRPFCQQLYNKEYKVSMKFNLYEQNILVPGQEVFGEMAGFLKKDGYIYYWLITDAEVNEKKGTAVLSFTNDTGSEDFTAKLSVNKDGTYTLTYEGGSTFKVPEGKKWKKLPKVMTFEIRK